LHKIKFLVQEELNNK